MVVILFMFIAIGVGFWYRRLSLMVNRPDQYERFFRAEKAFANLLIAATERAAGGLVAAVKAMVRRAGRKFNKL